MISKIAPKVSCVETSIAIPPESSELISVAEKKTTFYKVHQDTVKKIQKFREFEAHNYNTSMQQQLSDINHQLNYSYLIVPRFFTKDFEDDYCKSRNLLRKRRQKLWRRHS